MLRATLLFNQGRSIEAEVEIRAALSEGEESSYHHALLGLCLLNANLLTDARNEINSALASDPEDAFNHYAMSFVETVALRREDFIGRHRIIVDSTALRGSLKFALRAVELAPEENRFHLRVAEILQSLHQWEESVNFCESALRLEPHDCHAAVLLAEAFVQLRRHEPARRVLREALERNPTAALAHAGMGWALLRAGDRVRAEEFFNESLRMHADSTWAQEGALECTKRKYRFYRWLADLKQWFENQSRPVAVIAGLALAATGFGILSAYFIWLDPPLRKWIGNQGFAILTLALVVGGSVLVFFRNEIFLWLSRREVAAKTSVAAEQKRFTKQFLVLLLVGMGLALLNIWVEKRSEIAPAILAGFLPGGFSIAVAIKTFQPGKRRRWWIFYASLMFALSPVAVIGLYHFMEEIPKPLPLAVVMFLPLLPLIFAAETERRRTHREKHLRIVTPAADQNKIDSL
jgi:tetratricopeptide (TPR) repeat protein